MVALSGAVGGLLAGLIIAPFIYFFGEMRLFGMMYSVGRAGPGWFSHLLNSVVLGVFYVFWADYFSIGGWLLGLMYGLVLWFGWRSALVPSWLGMRPKFELHNLVVYLVYGAALDFLAGLFLRLF